MSKLLSRLNPMKPKTEKEKEAEAELVEKKKETDENNKKEDERQKKVEEAQRLEREKAKLQEEERADRREEDKRLREKRERRQELLRRNLDGSTRVFQMNMKAMKLKNVTEEALSGMSLRLTLGGNYAEREEPGKGLVRSGKHGAIFRTSASGKIEPDKTHFFKESFGMGIPVYWIGSYLDLEMQDFLLELHQSGFAGFNLRKRAVFRVPLATIAQVAAPAPLPPPPSLPLPSHPRPQGSVMREHEFIAPVSRAPIAVVHFAIYFQASRRQTDRRRLLG